MNESSKELYSETKTFFTKRIMELKELENVNNLDDCIDAIYSIRETVAYLEALRKQLEAVSEEFQTVVCMSLLTRHKKSHSTEYCTGVKRSTLSYNIPTKKKEPEEYCALMEFLNIPPDVIRQELVRVHWPAFREYATGLISKGIEPPIDPSKKTPHFGVTIRKKKDILAPEREEEQTPF